MDCPTCAKPAEPGAVDCYRCGERLMPSAAHPGYAAPVPRLSAVAGLGKALTVLLSVLAVGEAAQFVVTLAGGPAAALITVNLLLFVGIAPVFLVWFFRVRKNAGLWGPQTRAQGWTIGAWFTPVVNFWFPVQIMRDVWRASGAEPGGRAGVARVAAGWWTCWSLAWLTGYRTFTVHGTAADGSIVVTQQAGFFLDGTVVSASCLGLGALLMARMIAGITGMQAARGAA
ncbi:hypothetical protein ABIA35_005803 [Catenulispora sp. MAP12-49]|uniref:DUF4328 domain-containing protein n=1 Tax=Catenulispora sp. MAP12-49 TaxID=3156302 RepID=UPI0035119FC2